MCGRVRLDNDYSEIKIRLKFAPDAPASTYAVDYNKPPTMPMLVATRSVDGERIPKMMKWGLIPHWAKGRQARLFYLQRPVGRIHRQADIQGRLAARPALPTYLLHFGSLREVYRLIGYSAERNYEFVDCKSVWDQATAKLMREVANAFEKSGRHVTLDFSDEQLRLEDKTRVLFRVARSIRKEGHLTQSRVPRMREGPIRWIVAIRLTDDNRSIRDYLLIPAKGLAERHRAGAMVITDRSKKRLKFQSLNTASALAKSLKQQI